MAGLCLAAWREAGRVTEVEGQRVRESEVSATDLHLPPAHLPPATCTL